MCVASYLICFADKEKQQINGQIVIIHEFQLSEILTRADFYRVTLRSLIHQLSPV